MNTELVRGGSSLLIATTVPAILSPIMGCARQGFSFVTVSLHPQTLALASVVMSRPSLFRAWALGLKASRIHGTLARRIPPNRVHFGVLTEPLYYGLAFHFQLLSTVGLSPPQFLSITGWLTLA